MILAIVIGIATGLCANAFTWFFVQHLVPLYQDWTYQGIRIDGNWTIEHEGDPADGKGLSAGTLSATLKQRAHAVAGKATAVNRIGDDKTDVIDYIVEGQTRDRYVTLYFRTTNRHRIAHSSFLLEIVGAGGCMEGYRAFYGIEQRAVRAVECIWHADGGSSARSDCKS